MAFCCCYSAPLQAATPCCRSCCHCLIRGSSCRAGVAVCGRGSGSCSSGGSSGGSGGGSSAILFLIVVLILLLFARPPHQHCPSPFSLPAALSAGCRSPAFNAQLLVVVCSCLLPSLLSTEEDVVANAHGRMD